MFPQLRNLITSPIEFMAFLMTKQTQPSSYESFISVQLLAALHPLIEGGIETQQGG